MHIKLGNSTNQIHEDNETGDRIIEPRYEEN